MATADSISSKQQAGFTFNELLVAMAIVLVAVMGYSLSSANLFRRQSASHRSTAAINLARDKIEEVQALRILTDGDLCPDGGDRGISANGTTPGPFDRCWRIFTSSLGSNLKQIDVTVSWRDHEIHRITLSTLAFRSE